MKSLERARQQTAGTNHNVRQVLGWRFFFRVDHRCEERQRRGCFTGSLTKKLKSSYPSSRVAKRRGDPVSFSSRALQESTQGLWIYPFGARKLRTNTTYPLRA